MDLTATGNQGESFIAQFFSKERRKKHPWARGRWELRPDSFWPGQEHMGQQRGHIGKMSHQFANSFIPYIKKVKDFFP